MIENQELKAYNPQWTKKCPEESFFVNATFSRRDCPRDRKHSRINALGTEESLFVNASFSRRDYSRNRRQSRKVTIWNNYYLIIQLELLNNNYYSCCESSLSLAFVSSNSLWVEIYNRQQKQIKFQLRYIISPIKYL